MNYPITYSDVYRYRKLFLLSVMQPILTVELFYGTTNTWRGDALLDSGADNTAFDTSIAKWLNVDLSKCKISQMAGIGGQSRAYEQNLGIRLGPLRSPIACTVYFVEGLNRQLPNLLGRSGVFAHFQIGFDETEQKVYMASKSP